MYHARDSGYNGVQFDHVALRNLIHRLASTVPEALTSLGADALVCTGKSGTTIATALLARTPLNIVHVRKAGESSHGNMIEGSGMPFSRFVIFDDFTSSGQTVRTTLERMERRWPNISGDCAGVLVYGARPGGGDFSPAMRNVGLDTRHADLRVFHV